MFLNAKCLTLCLRSDLAEQSGEVSHAVSVSAFPRSLCFFNSLALLVF